MATKRRRPRGRRRQMGPVTATWFLLGGIINTAAAVLGSLTLLIVGLLSVVVALVSMAAGQGATTTRSAVGSPRNPAGAAKRTTSRPTRKPPHRGTLGSLTTRCKPRCQRSTKPAADCTCTCGGRWHGAQIPGTRANLRTPITRQRARARATGRIRNIASDD